MLRQPDGLESVSTERDALGFYACTKTVSGDERVFAPAPQMTGSMVTVTIKKLRKGDDGICHTPVDEN
ncbi:MAG: hypothetical protein K9W43_13265 [Candidatus Thorarchaeota archaeon]|nr:hypothetical protein [Candidatus Thorarchaeota archaeon]